MLRIHHKLMVPSQSLLLRTQQKYDRDSNLHTKKRTHILYWRVKAPCNPAIRHYCSERLPELKSYCKPFWPPSAGHRAGAKRVHPRSKVRVQLHGMRWHRERERRARWAPTFSSYSSVQKRCEKAVGKRCKSLPWEWGSEGQLLVLKFQQHCSCVRWFYKIYLQKINHPDRQKEIYRACKIRRTWFLDTHVTVNQEDPYKLYSQGRFRVTKHPVGMRVRGNVDEENGVEGPLGLRIGVEDSGGGTWWRISTPFWIMWPPWMVSTLPPPISAVFFVQTAGCRTGTGTFETRTRVSHVVTNINLWVKVLMIGLRPCMLWSIRHTQHLVVWLQLKPHDETRRYQPRKVCNFTCFEASYGRGIRSWQKGVCTLDWTGQRWVVCLCRCSHIQNAMVLTDVSWPQPTWRWKLKNYISVSMPKSISNASKSKRALWYNSFLRMLHFLRILKVMFVCDGTIPTLVCRRAHGGRALQRDVVARSSGYLCAPEMGFNNRTDQSFIF